MVKAHKSILISMILVSCILISICAFLFFAQNTAFADSTYTINVYENDNNALDRKGNLLGTISNLTQITNQDIIDANFETLETGYEYHYYLYDENAVDKCGEQIQDIPIELNADVDVLRIKTLKTFTITWKNVDGSILKEDHLTYGSTPAYAETPEYDDAQYTYTFDSWTPSIVPVSGDAEYTASYSTEIKKYTIRFVDFDNEELNVQENVEYGSTPIYGGIDPTRPSDAQFSYSFSGWEPSIVPVVGDATYVAVYSTTINKYTVLWKNHDDSILENDHNVPYGTIPEYNGATPIRNSDEKYSYLFTNWNPEPSAIKGNTEFIANYSRSLIDYKILFMYPEKPVEKTIHYEDKFGDIEEPKRTGYRFLNWTYNDEAVDISGEFKFTENITLYPKFEANEYSLVYTLDNADEEIKVNFDTENVDLKTERLNAFLENNIILGFYEINEDGKPGTIVAKNDLIIPKMIYPRNMKLNFVSISKEKLFITSLNISRTEGYNVEISIDDNVVDKSKDVKIEDIGNHNILIKDENGVELYSSDFVIKEDLGFESEEEFDEPITINSVYAKVFVDGKEIDPANFRIDKNGTHTIKVVGVNGYENTYSITYNNANIKKSLWLIGLSSIALIIFVILLALGRRRVVKYGSD